MLSVEQEAARDLVRARGDCRGGDLMSARHRVSKLLLRQGIVYCGGHAWTKVHDTWLRNRHFDAPGLQLAYETACDTMLAAVDRRARLDVAIAVMATDSDYTPVVTRLGCLRGVSTLTAFGLAVEIGDWQRLTGSSIGAYLFAGAHQTLLGHLPLAGGDHQDRQRPRPAAAGRGRPGTTDSAIGPERSCVAPLGPCQSCGPGPRTSSKPAPRPRNAW
ncbi:hypothetical protein M2275_008176 [Rhodococcus opacus]|nr:hypothetical protein [Rhodococcus opacus]